MGLFDALTNVTKAVVAVAVSPMALAVDIVTLPASADDFNKGPFDRTGKLLSTAGECISKAVEPD